MNDTSWVLAQRWWLWSLRDKLAPEKPWTMLTHIHWLTRYVQRIWFAARTTSNASVSAPSSTLSSLSRGQYHILCLMCIHPFPCFHSKLPVLGGQLSVPISNRTGRGHAQLWALHGGFGANIHSKWTKRCRFAPLLRGVGGMELA